MRRFVIPVVLVVGAIVVWFAPTSLEIDAVHQGETTEVSAPCAPAPVDLFRYGVFPDDAGAWYVANDGTGVFAPEGPCRPAAWWRTVLGAAMITAAAYIVLRHGERQRELVTT